MTDVWGNTLVCKEMNPDGLSARKPTPNFHHGSSGGLGGFGGLIGLMGIEPFPYLAILLKRVYTMRALLNRLLDRSRSATLPLTFF